MRLALLHECLSTSFNAQRKKLRWWLYIRWLPMPEIHPYGKSQSDTKNIYSVHIFPNPRSRSAAARLLSIEIINALSSSIIMPRNNKQKPPTRRCIALTKLGIQCKNTINCYHHRCPDKACPQGPQPHTSEEEEWTPLSIRQEYLSRASPCRTSTSGSPNGIGHRDTSRVPPSPGEIPNPNNTHRPNPLFHDGSSRISEVNEEDDDVQEQSSGPRHAQPSHDLLGLESPVQSPSIREEDTRIQHEEDNIAGPSRARGSTLRSIFERSNAAIRRRVINDGILRSPRFDPTLSDPNPESSETQTNIPNETRYDNEPVDARADSLTLAPSTRSSRPPTQSSPSNTNHSRNATPEIMHPADTARQSLTPPSRDSEPSEPGGT